MSIMPETLAAKRALVAELCRPLLLPLLADGHVVPLVLRNDFQFAPLPEAPGFELARLLAPAGHSATLLRGAEYAHSAAFAAPQAVRVEVLAGALLWWQASWGARAAPDAYRRLAVGSITSLAPGEEHSYLCLVPCLTYNLFTPAIDDVLA